MAFQKQMEVGEKFVSDFPVTKMYGWYYRLIHSTPLWLMDPRGGPPLKMGGPPLEFINIQPKKGGPPLEFINQRVVRL